MLVCSYLIFLRPENLKNDKLELFIRWFRVQRKKSTAGQLYSITRYPISYKKIMKYYFPSIRESRPMESWKGSYQGHVTFIPT